MVSRQNKRTGLVVFQLCGKEFNRMHNLMGHMHLHSDSKPFKCLYCPSKFTLKGNLTRHMKVKHGVMDRGLDERCKDAPNVEGAYIKLYSFNYFSPSRNVGEVSVGTLGSSAHNGLCSGQLEKVYFAELEWKPSFFHISSSHDLREVHNR